MNHAYQFALNLLKKAGLQKNLDAATGRWLFGAHLLAQIHSKINSD
jgi:hypothetical protein